MGHPSPAAPAGVKHRQSLGWGTLCRRREPVWGVGGQGKCRWGWGCGKGGTLEETRRKIGSDGAGGEATGENMGRMEETTPRRMRRRSKEREKPACPPPPPTSALPMLLLSRAGTAAFRAGCWPRRWPLGGTHRLGGAGRRCQSGG